MSNFNKSKINSFNMTKKILLLGILIAFLPFLSAQAVTLRVIDSSFISRYLGNILLEDNVFTTKSWYLEPDSQKRYLVAENKDIKNIVDKFGQKITTATLKKIPTTSGQKGVDYNVAKKYSGRFLIEQNKNNDIWYVNPLDLLRYKITNDDAGFKTLNELAVSLPLDKLSIVAIASNETTPNTEAAINFSRYNELRNVLKENYYQPEKLNDQTLFYGSLAGLANSLNDPYTQFFSPSAKSQFDDSVNGEVEGIGAIVDLKNNIFTIVTPLKDSPALKAGLEPNDQVLEVDGVSIRNFSLTKSISLIKGPKGTSVNLKIYRQAENKTFEIKITRDRVAIPNVEVKKLDNNIVYFSISTFSQNMVNEFNKLRQENVNSSTKGIIVDLRNNPGGYTDAAIALADIWLPTDVLILQEKFRDHTEKYYTNTDENLTIPTIVLINGSTASAAEIFSSALKENNLAKLVGQTSYGKGTGQMLYPFSDGSALKYTYFEWLTGLNNSVETRGLQPDFEVKNDNLTKIDGQLNKAIELLK